MFTMILLGRWQHYWLHWTYVIGYLIIVGFECLHFSESKHPSKDKLVMPTKNATNRNRKFYY